MSDIVFYQHCVEELTLDLENRFQESSQKETELNEAKREAKAKLNVQGVRALLDNLATGIFMVMAASYAVPP